MAACKINFSVMLVRKGNLRRSGESLYTKVLSTELFHVLADFLSEFSVDCVVLSDHTRSRQFYNTVHMCV